MAKNEFVSGRVERFRGDQIVVDLDYLGLVERELTAVGAKFKGQHERDDDLGLALITLEDTEEPVKRLRKNRQTQQALLELELKSLRERNKPPADLDLLLRGLRDRFARSYANFDVTMGKNRIVEQIKGFPHLGGGGVGDPAPADGEQLTAAAPHVAAQAGAGVRIGVLDTAITPKVIAGLNDRLDVTADAEIGDEQPSASTEPGRRQFKVTQGHGTFVVNLIAQQAPNAKLVVRRVLDEDAVGDAWDAAKQLVRLAREKVRIINLSFGSFTDDDQRPLVLSRAVDRVNADVVIVAAAGNHGDIAQIRRIRGLGHLGPRTPIWPAALDDVVAVDAVNDQGALAAFSARTPWVNAKALGVDVVSAFLDGKVTSQRVGGNVEQPLGRFHGVARWSGTSFAAAILSGVIAARTTRDDSPREVLRTLLARPAAENPARISRFTLADLGE